MPCHSPTHHARSHIGSITASRLVRSAIVLTAIGWGAAAALAEPAAQGTEVAFVAAVTGRVVAFSRGNPGLVDTLDTVKDRTRLDLQPNSELQICHLATQRLYILQGPSRASVSTGGVTIEAGKPLDTSKVPCAEPVVSKHQGGLLTRGVVAIEETSLRRNFIGK
jgi:hypothetical protein